MTWSLGETRALVLKAAKGAGMPWGLAEEVAFAADWLESRNFSGLAATVHYFRSLDAQGGYKIAECPISNGSWISDCGTLLGNFPLTVKQPLLLVPFISNVIVERRVLLEWHNNALLINSEDADNPGGGNPLGDGTGWECKTTISDLPLTPQGRSIRISSDREPMINELESFALRTYAPSTEHSRLVGAGAGVNDND